MQFRDNEDRNNQGNNNNQPPNWQRWIWPGLLLLLVLWTLFSSQNLMSGLSGPTSEVPFSTVRDQAERRNIRSISFEGETTLRGEFSSPVITQDASGRSINARRFTSTLPPGGAEVLLGILPENVVIEANPAQPSLLLILLNFAPLLLIIAFFVWTARRAQGQMGNIFSFGRSNAREYSAEMPRITFEDVAGQESAKNELAEIVDFLKSPEKYIELGARVPKGVLLVGPPGTGKTLMARAVAGEANVAFFSLAASEFVEMFVGVGASRVRDLFNRAKQNSPSIIFIDEIDAVGRRRGAGLGGGHDEREQTLNQMLAEMDGFDQQTNVIMIAATNRPDVLDPALLRPGRFDRQVTVGLPDRDGRSSILKVHTRGKPLADDVDLEAMAKATVGFSGADLANLANEAALAAARKSQRKITMSDFSGAFERIILGTESPPLSNTEERKIVAYHEAGHALVAMLTPGADPVLKVTIVPRGQALGVTAFLPDDDRRNYPRSYLEARIDVLLGGRIAEQVMFNEITTGASDDLRRATDMARRMVSQFGMSEAIGPLNFGEDESQPFLGYSLSQGRSYSEETASKIDAEVRRIVEGAYMKTTQLITENQLKLGKIAEALLDNEVVERDELLQIMQLDHDPLDDFSPFAAHPATSENGHHLDDVDHESDNASEDTDENQE